MKKEVRVRNVVTGAKATWTPDARQPEIPKGWVPINSSRRTRPAATPKTEGGYRIQTRVRDGKTEYRILNSSRQVVAQGVFNTKSDGKKDERKSRKMNAAVGTGSSSVLFEMATRCDDEDQAVEVFDELADWFEDRLEDEFEGPYSGRIKINLQTESRPNGDVQKVMFAFDEVFGDPEDKVYDLVGEFNRKQSASGLPTVTIVDVLR